MLLGVCYVHYTVYCLISIGRLLLHTLYKVLIWLLLYQCLVHCFLHISINYYIYHCNLVSSEFSTPIQWKSSNRYQISVTFITHYGHTDFEDNFKWVVVQCFIDQYDKNWSWIRDIIVMCIYYGYCIQYEQ